MTETLLTWAISMKVVPTADGGDLLDGRVALPTCDPGERFLFWLREDSPFTRLTGEHQGSLTFAFT